MNGNNSKNLFQTLASLVGVASASALLSLPAFAMHSSGERRMVISEAQPSQTLHAQVGGTTGGTTGGSSSTGSSSGKQHHRKHTGTNQNTSGSNTTSGQNTSKGVRGLW